MDEKGHIFPDFAGIVKPGTLPTSCKQFCFNAMCNNGSQMNDSLIWNEYFTNCECESCPGWQVEIGMAIPSTALNTNQWEYKKQEHQ